tara:strand:- start:2882 stop:4069 length:1188 start_codon:yes stop_codon:yes gene_type:complete
MEFIKNIKNKGLPVIIFGAGIVGEVLYRACHSAGIEIEGFCDNNLNKKSLCNLEVIHTSNLKIKYGDAIFLISTADMKDVVDQLKELGYSEWYAASLLLRDFDIYQYQFSASIDFVEYAVGTALLCQDSYITPDKLFLRSLDIITTERCSLKCRDCSNLTQYYEAPKDCDVKELIKMIDRFCDIVDEFNEFRVLGGEPFMNKEAHLVIKRLIDEPKAKKVVIYTNGTMIPREDQIEYLKDDKILFIITDYGDLSRRLDDLVKILKQHKITYYVQKVGGWTDCSKIKKRDRDVEQQKEIFRNCCAKNTITLSKGKLYRCPFSANAAGLQAVPDSKNDYIDIFDKGIDVKKMKEKIKKFLIEKNFLETCDYCNGRTHGDPEIEPAIQASKPLDYQKY